MIIYLASPYSHPDPAVREARYQAACRVTAELMRGGRAVFSPIVHSHPLTAFGLPTNWAFWERCDCEVLQRCDGVFVLMLEGWQRIIGVQAEIKLATEMAKPVSFLNPETLTHGT